MEVLNATSGKIGACVVGPKYYLHQNIKLGEAALCVARDGNNVGKPYVWIIAGLETLIDYISLARHKNELPDDVSNTLLAKLDDAKKKVPNSHVGRLASVLGLEVDELADLIKIAQVCVSAPVEGISDFSSNKPKLISKSTNYAGIH